MSSKKSATSISKGAVPPRTQDIKHRADHTDAVLFLSIHKHRANHTSAILIESTSEGADLLNTVKESS